MFSTYVEVILNVIFSRRTIISVLHVCGGDPMCIFYLPNGRSCSPRMWRWSSDPEFISFTVFVFSTYVEVILIAAVVRLEDKCVLHVCGGDPTTLWILTALKACSPRMWRWSWILWRKLWWCRVFSTYVEVIPAATFSMYSVLSVLHVCGGDPCYHSNNCIRYRCSPRMWRWSRSCHFHQKLTWVFSTYVEVILTAQIFTV